MKVIILAAGQGTRLRPFTNDRPKCMVELKGKPLLHYQLTTLKQCGVEDKDIALAAGYLQEKLVAPGLVQYRNELYEQTNMVSTLFAAEAFMQPNEDLIISYGDIVFEQKVFQKLLDTEGEVVIAADLDWYELWKIRMVNPLDDAETFKMNDEGKVLELGKTPQTLQEAQAQYIGLIKISANKVADFINHYKNRDRSAIYDVKDYKNMYMTSLLQDLIDSGWHAQAALINNGWLEVDSVDDLAAYEKEDKVII